jgi:glycine oxidase
VTTLERAPMQTVIAGNGILALTTAFRLARRAAAGDRIVLVGQQARPGSATLAAAAMLNSFAEIEAGSLESELDLYRFELSHLASRMWPRFVEDIIRAGGEALPPQCARCEGLCGGCYARGTYIINNTAADDLDDVNFDAILAAVQRFDEPHALVSPSQIPNYRPAQRYRSTRALFLPNEGWLNPRLTVEALDAALGRFRQVHRVEGSVDRLVGGAAGIEAAVLEGGERLEGDQFLLATGATAWDLLQRSGLQLPMQRVFYGVGVSLEIRSPDAPHTQCVRTPNRGLACGIYTVPFFQGPGAAHDHVLVGATNFISAVPYPNGRLTSVETLMRAAMEQINTDFYRADLVRVNVGWRPTSQDTYPLIGRSSIPNLVIATGTKRDGFHLSPLLSEYLAAMLHGEPVDPRFDVFAPERPVIRALTREQAIEKALRHQVNADYQHGYSPSHSRMPENLAAAYRTRLEQLHDQVGAKSWGIPPEMLDMYRYGHARADGA